MMNRRLQILPVILSGIATAIGALVALLLLIFYLIYASPARAGALDLCDSLVNLYGVAMDIRMQGYSEHQAYLGVAERVDTQLEREAWAGVVGVVYDLPHSGLEGPGRADTLSTVWDTCIDELGQGNDPGSN